MDDEIWLGYVPANAANTNGLGNFQPNAFDDRAETSFGYTYLLNGDSSPGGPVVRQTYYDQDTWEYKTPLSVTYSIEVTHPGAGVLIQDVT